ncbi:unnamed protein product [Pieris brassicae]|uniref:Uncharacterized protein n=1 Tax=Pieris brassicae TaxID=7116 RepID=A0A9P0U0Q4_PIEBR|nr:unnamed protein product [Pieris brassicae]
MVYIEGHHPVPFSFTRLSRSLRDARHVCKYYTRHSCSKPFPANPSQYGPTWISILSRPYSHTPTGRDPCTRSLMQQVKTAEIYAQQIASADALNAILRMYINRFERNGSYPTHAHVTSSAPCPVRCYATIYCRGTFLCDCTTHCVRMDTD